MIRIEGDDDWSIEVVGESFYQEALTKIAGPKTHDGVEHLCLAHVVPDNDNQYDSNAVAVFIDGHKVGHLSREDAQGWRSALDRQGLTGKTCAVDAQITGGWHRKLQNGSVTEGHFSVTLDL